MCLSAQRIVTMPVVAFHGPWEASKAVRIALGVRSRWHTRDRQQTSPHQIYNGTALSKMSWSFDMQQ